MKMASIPLHSVQAQQRWVTSKKTAKYGSALRESLVFLGRAYGDRIGIRIVLEGGGVGFFPFHLFLARSMALARKAGHSIT